MRTTMGKFKEIAIELMEEEEAQLRRGAEIAAEIMDRHDAKERQHESAAHDVEAIFNTYEIETIVMLLSQETKDKLFNSLLEYMDD